MTNEFPAEDKQLTVGDFFRRVVGACVEIGKLSQQVEDMRRGMAEERASRQAAHEEVAAVDGLVEFLRARLEDDARAARAVRWDDWNDGTVWAELDSWTAEHVRRHDPNRVQREVEANHLLVDECTILLRSTRHSSQALRFMASKTLRALARSYADHEDYRKEWWQ